MTIKWTKNTSVRLTQRLVRGNVLEGLGFENCRIEGPAVVNPTTDCEFSNCEFFVPGGLLQKLQDDGSLSLWAGLDDDSNPVAAACQAGPLPNGQIRVSTTSTLLAAGFQIEFTPAWNARAPDRHLDATPSTVDLESVCRFIEAFDEPIKNEWR